MKNSWLFPEIIVKFPAVVPKKKRAKNGKRKIAFAEIQQMRAEHAAGQSVAKIAKAHGHDYTYVYTMLHYGIREFE